MDLLSESEQKEFIELDESISSEAVYEWAKNKNFLKEVDMKYSSYYKLKKGQYLPLLQELFPINEVKVRIWVELMEKDKVTGYCASNYFGIGEPCPFIIDANVPKEFQDYVAIHEIFKGKMFPRSRESYLSRKFNTEEQGLPFISDPPNIDAHKHACVIELGNALMEGEDFLVRYVQWLPDEYFENADPDYWKKHDKATMSGLELVTDLFEITHAIYSLDKMVKDHHWLKKYGIKEYKYLDSKEISF